MDTRALILLLLCHVAQTTVVRPVFLGCYEQNDYTHYEWDRTWLSTPSYPASQIYTDCETRAKQRDWNVFAVNADKSCHGSTTNNAIKLLRNTKVRGQSECSGKVGGPETMSTYQLVEERTVQFNEKKPSEVNCGYDDHTSIKIWKATLSNPTNCEAGKETNVTQDLVGKCEGKSYCKWGSDFSYTRENCAYKDLSITYGCAFDDLNKDNEWRFPNINLVWMVPPGICILLYLLHKHRRSILRDVPGTRDCCWKLHKCLPCLQIYPSRATDPHSVFQAAAAAPQVNVHANPNRETVDNEQEVGTVNHGIVTYPPSNNYPPVVGTEVPVIPPPYNPTQHSTEMPAPPPPSYNDVVSAPPGSSRTSGGWFFKTTR